MVAHDVLRVVDHTTTIAGEQATGMNGVEITPRVDTVAAWHDHSLSLAATGTAGERRIILQPMPRGRPGLREGAVAVQIEEVERGEGHGASRPVARLEDGLDALAAVPGDRLAVRHDRRDGPADLAQPGQPRKAGSARGRDG